jgi:photosynthetic reaction center cytochrome c subunit
MTYTAAAYHNLGACMRRVAAAPFALLTIVLTLVACPASPARAGQQPQPADPAQNPEPQMMDTPTIKVLRGLTVPEFDDEMKGFVEALGAPNCGYCHVRRDFPKEDNPRKAVARRMIQMTLAINRQWYPDFVPGYGQSKLGRITCFTCHQGNEQPKVNPAGPMR